MKFTQNNLWEPEDDKDIIYSGIIFFRFLSNPGMPVTTANMTDLPFPADGEYRIDMRADPLVESMVLLRLKNGVLDGGQLPAVECEDTGHVEYWKDGLLHRENGLPAVITNFGTQEEFWREGKLLGIKADDELCARPDFTVINTMTAIEAKRKLGW